MGQQKEQAELEGEQWTHEARGPRALDKGKRESRAGGQKDKERP